jgi:hypothetical protein
MMFGATIISSLQFEEDEPLQLIHHLSKVNYENERIYFSVSLLFSHYIVVFLQIINTFGAELETSIGQTAALLANPANVEGNISSLELQSRSAISICVALLLKRFIQVRSPPILLLELILGSL